MSEIQNFSNNSEWLQHNKNNIKNDIIDHFFTQRKITETIEKLDSSLVRTEEKIKKVQNFLALNFPINKLSKKLNISNEKIEINVEIWGDRNFHFNGSIIANTENIPSILVKLQNDTQIFVKITFDNNNYISFIPIHKRYQSDNIIDDKN